jgi:hypothetical protein
LEQGPQKVNGRMFFPNVADNLMNKIDLNRYEVNPETGVREILPEYRMLETSRADMMFWLFSRITANRAGVSTFHLIERDLRNHFETTVDEVNGNREWNVTFVDFIPQTKKEVVIFNIFSNAIDHIWVDRSINN